MSVVQKALDILEEVQTADQESSVLIDSHDLVVFNDDYNTFDHVIETLMRVCKHSALQAEQCTHLIHHVGKCTVKKGAFDILQPMKRAILEAGISAAIH